MRRLDPVAVATGHGRRFSSGLLNEDPSNRFGRRPKEMPATRPAFLPG